MQKPLDLVPFYNEAKTLRDWGISKASGWPAPEGASDTDAGLAVLFATPGNPLKFIGREAVEATGKRLYPMFRRQAGQAMRHLRGADPREIRYAVSEEAERAVPRAILDKNTGLAAVQELEKETLHQDVAKAAIKEGKFSRKVLDDYLVAGDRHVPGMPRRTPSGPVQYEYGYYSPDLNEMLDYNTGDNVQNYLIRKFMSERGFSE
jgi:hypothetical protein